jgi:hypothetical protein
MRLIPFLAAAALAAEPSLDLTVYNNDLALVKDHRTLELAKGRSSLPWENVAQTLDASSASFSSPGARVLEQNYRYDLVSRAVLLQKYLGREVKLVQEVQAQDGRTISTETVGKILSLEGEKITSLESNGRILLDPPGRVVLPALPEGLLVRPSLVLDLQSPQGGKVDAELRYLCKGLSWHADYIAVLDSQDRSLDLEGLVTLSNHSGTAFRDARLKLVAGDVNQIPERVARPVFRKASMSMDLGSAGGIEDDGFSEQGLMEYHLYSLGRPATLLDNEQKQVSLLGARGAKVRKRYVFDESTSSRYWWWGREPDTKDGRKLAVFVDVENKEGNHLGIALPKGKVRVYKADASGQLQFVGEDRIDHTPRDETLHLALGQAFDLRGKRVVESSTANKDERTETVAITLRNAKDERVEVEVVEHLAPSNWTIKGETSPYEKRDASTIAFRVAVPARGNATVRYTSRTGPQPKESTPDF